MTLCTVKGVTQSYDGTEDNQLTLQLWGAFQPLSANCLGFIPHLLFGLVSGLLLVLLSGAAVSGFHPKKKRSCDKLIQPNVHYLPPPNC